MTIKAKVKFTNKQREVQNAVDKGVFKNLGHMAASVRKMIVAVIGRAPKGSASPEGGPLYTHKGAFLRRAVRFDVDRQQEDAVIGFQASKVGDVAAVHEFGETRKGTRYPKRPTLGVALDKVAPRLGGVWQGSIGK